MTFQWRWDTLTPSDNNHIIHRPNTPPCKAKMAYRMDTAGSSVNQIAGSITDDGTADPAEISDNQFTLFPSRRARQRWGPEFSIKFTFVNVDGCRFAIALETEAPTSVAPA